MPLRSVEGYLAPGILSGAGGLVPTSALGPCLEAAFLDLGVENDSRRRVLARTLEEEYALRADSAPVGLGALSRLLDSVEQRAAKEVRSNGTKSVEEAEL